MTAHRRAAAAALLAGLVAGAPGVAQDGAAQDGTAQDGTPLSSIDWLSDSLADDAALRPEPGLEPGPESGPDLRPERRAPPVAGGGSALAPPVSVAPLDAPAPDGVGLVAPEAAGLAPSLWGGSTTDAIARRLAALPDRPLPAAREALKRLILARLDPPGGGGTPGALALARIDTLLRWGALAEAAELIEAAGTERPELFRRAFDIALLQEREDQGCAVLQASPGIAPSIPVRIFCLARSGDWPAAALTLETAEALGALTPEEDALLARFLDADLADPDAPLPPRATLTPLDWRMLEAIGEGPPTSGLPLAFAHAELRPTSGWKARIEATERLVRAGALPPARLLAVYTERDPSASGGVWERVGWVQTLDAALAQGRTRTVARRLGDAWAEMQAAGLGPAFVALFAERLRAADLTGEAGLLAHRIALLGPDYETAALAPPEGADPLALAFARGLPPEEAPDPAAPIASASIAPAPVTSALAAAFAEPPPPLPRELARLQDESRFGEALVAALATVADGTQADPGDLTGALVFLRAAGLEDTARRAALQIHLLGAGA